MTAVPDTTPSDSDRSACLSRGLEAARHFSLPFRQRNWRGIAGNWQGVGIGSSLDFQDHRPYVPGDDPRYINWAAYARTGQFTMKLYRPEISPAVDLAVDISASMFATAEKHARLLELVAFCTACAARTGAGLRCYTVGHKGARLLDSISLSKLALPQPTRGSENALRFETVPWRTNALRVLITDLLYSANCAPTFRSSLSGSGFTVVFVPFTRPEAHPPWTGLLELLDIETGKSRVRRWTEKDEKNYRSAYNAHIEQWRMFFRKHHAATAFVPAEGPLGKALQAEATSTGAVEVLL